MSIKTLVFSDYLKLSLESKQLGQKGFLLLLPTSGERMRMNLSEKQRDDMLVFLQEF